MTYYKYPKKGAPQAKSPSSRYYLGENEKDLLIRILFELRRLNKNLEKLGIEPEGPEGGEENEEGTQ